MYRGFDKNLAGFCIAAVLIFTAGTTPCSAKTKDLFPDFYFDTTYGFTTSKSKLVASNDLGSTFSYGLGSYAGKEAVLGFHLGFSTDTIAYELNTSSITLGWQETAIHYRMGPFYIGPIFGQVDVKSSKEGSDIIDAKGSGIGGTTGLIMSVGRKSAIYLKVSSLSISAMKDTSDQTVSVNSRFDIDIGTSIKISRDLFSLIFGYKQRTMAISYGSSYNEAMYTTYFGFRTSVSL